MNTNTFFRWAAPVLVAAVLPSVDALASDEGHEGIRPVPVTRLDLKRALEASKQAEPRLPLPPITDEERERASAGVLRVVNNGRMRRHYLPPGFVSGGFPRRDESGMTLGYPFQTKVFWVVSRANNCTYCLGHQESKLAAAGVDEASIASLDGDWSDLLPADRAAFAFARTMTLAPHEVADSDIDALRVHYSDREIAELIYIIGSFNAMNRWTGALNIPQEGHREYLTEGDDGRDNGPSQVAPIDPTGGSSGTQFAMPQARPPLESRDEVEERLDDSRTRSPRIALVDPASFPEDHGLEFGEGGPPQWLRVLAYFPGVGFDRARILKAVEREGTLDPLLRARVARQAARHDRAWYALAHANDRLAAMGQTDEQIQELDGDRASMEEADRLALSFAERLTVDPALVSDGDVARLREHFTDHQVAELVAVVAEAVFFNRLTEAAGLRIE